MYLSTMLDTDINQYLSSGMDIGERIAFGLKMLLLGLGTVFVVLCIIWIFLVLFRVFFYTIPNMRRAKAKAKDEASLPAKEVPATSLDTDDGELVAVITAAIAAAMEQSLPGSTKSGFKVVSFKRK